MHHAVNELLRRAEAIGDPLVAPPILDPWGRLGHALMQMLTYKNGFYAYESCLLVRPLHRKSPPLGLVEWNASPLWKSAYDQNLEDALFFAEDVFGCQYAIGNEQVCFFDPETASLEPITDSLHAWAEYMIEEYPLRTGYPLGHKWQLENGPLQPGTRLLPKVPFILGGQYECTNLYPLADTEGMQFRASIANQIRDLPDGTEVILRDKHFPPPPS